MSDTSIEYGSLMHDAMQDLMRKVLVQIAEHGLPGDHHFFITFDTAHPDAELADWLSDRYPTEMTVVMQHEYENLQVTQEGFSVTLSFGEKPEAIFVPFDAVKTFVDPSVEFGLRFDAHTGEDEENAAQEAGEEHSADITPATARKPVADADKPEQDGDAEIVSLDSFRK